MEPSEAALDHCHTEPLQTHLLELRERERERESFGECTVQKRSFTTPRSGCLGVVLSLVMLVGFEIATSSIFQLLLRVLRAIPTELSLLKPAMNITVLCPE